MKLTSQQYAELLRNHPKLAPTITSDCDSHSRAIAKLESNPCHAPLGEKKLQGATETAIVRITSIRKNLLDTDNICQKYLVDLLRYAGILYDDNPEQTTIQTSQRKCKDGEQEQTLVEIEIFPSRLRDGV